jgi:hypothetical protein
LAKVEIVSEPYSGVSSQKKRGKGKKRRKPFLFQCTKFHPKADLPDALQGEAEHQSLIERDRETERSRDLEIKYYSHLNIELGMGGDLTDHLNQFTAMVVEGIDHLILK